jgi:hypothetical protein
MQPRVDIFYSTKFCRMISTNRAKNSGNMIHNYATEERGVGVHYVTESSLGNSNTSSVTIQTLPSVVFNDEQQKLILDSTLMGVINDVSFPHKQFIVYEREMNADEKLAKKVLTNINGKVEDWDAIKDTVHKN